jgi:uncharacterized protein (TIGR03435 family)
MTRTKTIALVSIAVLLIAAVVTVKMIFFPSVKDTWFQTNGQKLRQVPAGIVVVRPTHFPKSPTNGRASANVKGKGWLVGRNVSFQQLMATAYSYNPGRIVLPPSAPKNNFDFLVTALSEPNEHLQLAIRKKTGYTASVETRDTDVLALKVEDANSPGLKVSGDGEKEDGSVKNGRLYFTHMKLNVVTDGMESMLKTPVVDKTGLTNFYDFSLAWDPQTRRQIQNGTLDPDTGKKILDGWGLGLEPDTASIEMLVVKKVN